MAVIITNMDMPKGCWYETDKKLSNVTTCPLIGECRNKHYNVNKLNERPNDCPLKSTDENTVSEKSYTEEFNARKEAEFELYKLRRNIDEMIAEIEQLKVWNDGETVIKYGSLSIIHKYCDKENN